MNLQMLTSHPWFGTGIAALVAVPLALVVYRIGGLLLLRVTRPAPALHAMVGKSRSAARWVLPLVALQMVWQAAPDELHWIGSVRHLNGLLLIYLSINLCHQKIHQIFNHLFLLLLLL